MNPTRLTAIAVAGFVLIGGGFFVAKSMYGWGLNEYAVVCDSFTETSNAMGADKTMLPMLWAERLDKRLSSRGRARRTLEILARVQPKERYILLKASAAEAGYPDWDCPAIRGAFKTDEARK